MNGMRLIAAGLALALSAPMALGQAAAPALPDALWYDGPGTSSPGQGRMRIVFDGQGTAAALTPDQWWFYSQAYRTRLTDLAFRMPVASAIPRARAAAIGDLAARYPAVRASRISVRPLDSQRIVPGF